MPLLEWNDTFSVGVDFFDGQHKRLVGLLNDLHDAMRVGKGAEVMGRVFQSLVDYTVHHFADEESAMEQYGFSGLEAHRREHEQLTRQVLDYKTKFETKQVLISIELLDFLKGWLTHHIMETDKLYGPTLAVKNTP
jgi:hemerythrin